MSDTTVIILASGQLPDQHLGPAPLLHSHPLDLPAGSDLALQRISSHHRQEHPDSELVVVMDKHTENHYNCVESMIDRRLLIQSQPSVGASLLTAIKNLSSQEIIVNPITCLPSNGSMKSTSIVISDIPLQRQNWSAFSTHSPRSRHHLLSKLDPIDPIEPSSFPFTGLLAANRNVLIQVLQDLSTDQQHDLGWVATVLLEQHSAKVLRAPWYDLGHRACYARSRRSQMVSRSHNKVNYNEIGDLIQKQSSDKDRLHAEAAYFRSLPSQLRRHFPALISYSKTKGLELEYIPFTSLTELFLHWEIGLEGWKSIWRRLNCIIDEFQNHENQINGDCSWLYSKKLEQRLNLLKQNPPDIQWGNFWTTPLLLNGNSLPSPAECAKLVQGGLRGLEEDRPLQRIHGDLCFNNILAEPLYASLRLIDPRGETPKQQLIPAGYGDPRYDLVKLLHSGCYYYDVIVHELYVLNSNPVSGWQAQLFLPRQAFIISEQLRVFVRQRGLEPNEARWLTASLFFSMLPLHRDNSLRQRMLCLVACCIAQDCFSILLP